MKIRTLVPGALFIATAVMTLSCSKNDNGKPGNVPVVRTSEVMGITSSTAFCTADVMDEGEASVTARGICFSSSSQKPTVNDRTISGGAGTGNYKVELKGLLESTTYYMCAYATSSTGTGYGDVISFSTMPLVTDICGNKYGSVRIGDQTWLTSNLKTTKFLNGDPITKLTSSEEAASLKPGDPACCSYRFNETISNTYGLFYNWWAAIDSRKICPAGWHVPSDAEWATLINNVGGALKASFNLRSQGWEGDVQNTNSSGFTALPGGFCNVLFGHGLGYTVSYWTKDESPANKDRVIYYTIDIDNNAAPGTGDKNGSVYIRCVKD